MRRIRASVLDVPVFLKVMGIAIGPTLLMAGGLFWQIHVTWHHKLLGELEKRGELLGVDLAIHSEEFLRGKQWGELQELLDEAQSRFPDVEYLIVLGSDGIPLGHTFAGEPPAGLLKVDGPDATIETRVVPLRTGGGMVRDVSVPIRVGQGGIVRVGMSEQRVLQEVNWMMGRVAALIILITLLSMAAAWTLTSVLTRPIRELVRLTRAVKEGAYGAVAQVSTRDELGELSVAFNEMTLALKLKAATQRRLTRQVISAAEEERKRVARELHDHTGQALVSLIAGVNALESRGGDGTRQNELSRLRELAENTLREVHDLSLALRPPELDEFGLVAALHRHCEAFGRQLDIGAEFQAIGLDQEARMASDLEVALYRIVQEALTNAARHGRARSVHVLLQRLERDLLLVVEDDGQGMDASEWRTACILNGHLGLLGMEERAGLLGGTLRVESRRGSGMSLFVQIPLTTELADAKDPRTNRG